MRISDLTLALVLLLLPGAVLCEEGQPAPSDDMVVLGGVELCGDIEPAIQVLKSSDPKKAAKWDKARANKRKVKKDGTIRWDMDKSSVDLPMVPALCKKNQSVAISELEGKVLAVTIHYPSDVLVAADKTAFERLEETLTKQKGSPTFSHGTIEDIQFKRMDQIKREWGEGDKLIVLLWSRAGGADLEFWCSPLRDHVLGTDDTASMF